MDASILKLICAIAWCLAGFGLLLATAYSHQKYITVKDVIMASIGSFFFGLFALLIYVPFANNGWFDKKLFQKKS